MNFSTSTLSYIITNIKLTTINPITIKLNDMGTSIDILR